MKSEEAKYIIIGRYKAEAYQVLSKRTRYQTRFLDIAVAKGFEMEPVGRLAGASLAMPQS
ncbi:hypothetical protein [Pseudomonas marincola]|uniref:hypothetical protein n=1 Tax=Pseudomonas marincola TaxID=437900 RepID=UPI0008E0D01A|nr:hypothetical protein [Pseudomonas marincola]SFU20316.1 hypothetical protein SAMN05216264_12518 [Pseudomonas marincola]